MFERFNASHVILTDNLTLLGYDLVFRPVTPGVLPPQSAPSAAYTIDAATMVFLGNRLLAHISLLSHARFTNPRITLQKKSRPEGFPSRAAVFLRRGVTCLAVKRSAPR
jgi:hypothetical protein